MYIVGHPVYRGFARRRVCRMASKKTRKNHSIQHLLELPSSRETKPSQFSTKEPTRSLPISTPRQVPITVLHPTPKKFLFYEKINISPWSDC
ncbi:hypothetical protein HZH66_000824 [Vespula vulgaris]|uniref:Uncharacterized protein n=1 Tax=Vespula vulgaris TaxID=7454 RepID=A0A834KS38_VESVU|nr:hypothetical protein HZH66_000824 [Vespula vulgaris]